MPVEVGEEVDCSGIETVFRCRLTFKDAREEIVAEVFDQQKTPVGTIRQNLGR